MTTVPPREAITFRPVADADLPFLRYLYGTTRADEMQLVPWDEATKTTFLDMQFHAQTTHYADYYPDCEFMIIQLHGAAIGRLYLDRRPDELHILDIALLPQARRRGIGRMLLEEILEEGRASGRKVSIYVEHYNPARRLYDRLQFRHVSTNGVYHYMEWQPS